MKNPYFPNEEESHTESRSGLNIELDRPMDELQKWWMMRDWMQVLNSSGRRYKFRRPTSWTGKDGKTYGHSNEFISSTCGCGHGGEVHSWRHCRECDCRAGWVDAPSDVF